MKNSLNYYIRLYSLGSREVDRLIVSVFLRVNNLYPKHNLLLKEYFIEENDTEEYSRLNKILSSNKNHHFTFETLIEIFENTISSADKKINGAVYTPEKIRNYIVQETLRKTGNSNNDSLRIADISCGCGAFLFSVATEIKNQKNIPYSIIFKKNIYGLDIQEQAIIRTKLLLTLLALTSGEDKPAYDFNLFSGDALDFDWSSKVNLFQGFDYILGNPPYVTARNLDKETKEKLKQIEVCQLGNTDLYIAFFQVAIEKLAPSGILGFITMNSFFKSLNARALRMYFHNKNLSLDIIDFGAEQVFKSQNTYTCITFIENRNRNFVSYVKTSLSKLHNKKKVYNIGYNALNPGKGWNLSNNKVILKIESTGIPFGQIYRTRHGIATLKNDIYIFSPVNEDDKYYYLQNGSLYKIEKEICRDIINPNKLNSEIDFETIREKVIFPYERGKTTKILSEKKITEKFPEAYKYLQHKKNYLDQRDKGKGNYESWFAFGRRQSLSRYKYKMFLPKYSSKPPKFSISADDELLFYNGLAIIGNSEEDLIIIKKFMESSVFWYYITNTSKPYSSNFYSLNWNYIKHFGIYGLDDIEKEFLLKETNREVLDKFFQDRYGVMLK